MAHTRRTLKLDGDWDLRLTDAGDIAVCGGAEATAQNVANECRLFTRDAYFQQLKGVPHYLTTLGTKLPVRPLLRSYLRQAAGRVPDVREVLEIVMEDFDMERRKLSGIISFTTAEGENVSVNV